MATTGIDNSSSSNLAAIRELVSKYSQATGSSAKGLATSLEHALQKNIVDSKKASALVKPLKADQVQALQKFLETRPALKAYFEDAFAVVSTNKHRDRDHGTAAAKTKVPVGGSDKIKSGTVRGESQVAAQLAGNSDQEVSGAKSARTAKTDAKGDTEAAKKTRKKAVAASEEVAAEGIAGKNPAAPPPPEQVFENVLVYLKNAVDGKGDALYGKLQEKQIEIHQAEQNLAGATARLNEISADPKANKDEIRQLKSFIASLKNLPKEKAALKKLEEQVQKHASTAGIVQQYFMGAASLDDDSAQGKVARGILSHISGRPTDALTEDQKIRLDGILGSPKGKALGELGPIFDQIDKLRDLPPKAQGDALAELMYDKAKGNPFDSAKYEEFAKHFRNANTPADVAAAKAEADGKTTAKDAGPQQAAAAPQAAVDGAGGPPNGQNGANVTNGAHGPNGPNGPKPPNDEKSFDPNDPAWFGMSKARRAELVDGNHHDLIRAIDQYHSELRAFHLSSAARLNAMQGILQSGLPIEAVLLMFMALMTENEEQKLKLKMCETTVAEQFDRTNRKIETDKGFARDVLNKYESKDGVQPTEYERGEKARFQKMAGEVVVPGITEEQAAAKRTFGESMLAKYNANPPTVTDEERALHPRDEMEKLAQTKPTPDTVKNVDVALNPADYGFTQKSSSTLTQEMQTQMQTYKQMIETLTSVMRMLQDIVAKIIQNIR